MKKIRATISDMYNYCYNGYSEVFNFLHAISDDTKNSELYKLYSAKKAVDDVSGSGFVIDVSNGYFIDSRIENLFGDFVIDKIYTDDFSNPVFAKRKISNLSESFLEIYKHKYDALAKSLTWTYEPLNNYDRTEKTTVIKSGNETDENSTTKNDDNTTTLNLDITTTTTRTGSETDSNNNTQTDGGKTTQVTDTQTANSQTGYNTNAVDNTTNTGTVTNNLDTTTTTKGENTRTYNNVTDATTNGGTNTTTYTGKTTDSGTATHAYNDVTDKTESRIYGNIGVTTSMQLVKSYRQDEALFSFWDTFIKDYVTFICRADFEREVDE